MNRRQFLSRSVAAVATLGVPAFLSMPSAESNSSSRSRGGRRNYIWFDKNNLIVQANGDGADTAQREGMYWFARGMFRSGADFSNTREWIVVRPNEDAKTSDATLYRSIIHKFLVRDAGGKLVGFRRHPYQKGDNSDPSKMSRDQLLPLIAAMSVWDDWDTLRDVYDFFSRQPGPLSFLNGDWMDMFRQYIRRARNEAVDETIDKTLLDGAVEARLCCIEDANDVGDDLNLAILLTLSEMPRQKKDYIPAIRKKFTEHRPVNYGIYLDAYYKHYRRRTNLAASDMIKRIEEGIKAGWRPSCSSAVGAFRWYCRSESGGSPGLASMMEPIINRYLGAITPAASTTFKRYDCGSASALRKFFCQRN